MREYGVCFFGVSRPVGLSELESLDDGGGNLLHVVHAELTHVGNTESLVLQATVAVTQLHVALGESLVELGNGDELGAALGMGIDNGECLGKILAVGIHAEVLVCPGAGELGALLVAGKAVLDTLDLHNLLQLLVESVHEGKAGGGGVLVVLLVDEVPKGAQVEVQATGGYLFFRL